VQVLNLGIGVLLTLHEDSEIICSTELCEVKLDLDDCLKMSDESRVSAVAGSNLK
jgi:hypothetical protein